MLILTIFVLLSFYKLTKGNKMFNVNMSQLVQPLKNRNMTYIKNSDGTVTVDGKVFDREIDLENYLMTIPRKDI